MLGGSIGNREKDEPLGTSLENHFNFFFQQRINQEELRDDPQKMKMWI
jgi:hypothetical protein